MRLSVGRDTLLKRLGTSSSPADAQFAKLFLFVKKLIFATIVAETFLIHWFWSWPENPAEERMWSKAGIESAASLFFYRYTGGYGHILHKFKYGCNIPLGMAMGRDLGEKMVQGGRFKDIDAIVPIPLHWRRQWHRGFNQAEIVSRGVAGGLGALSHGKVIPVIRNLVKRVKNTSTQTRLTGKEKAEKCKKCLSGREESRLATPFERHKSHIARG